MENKIEASLVRRGLTFFPCPAPWIVVHRNLETSRQRLTLIARHCQIGILRLEH
jgi:hypothetical protein